MVRSFWTSISYRFFQNPKVTIHALLEGHHEQTQRRMMGSPVVRIVHDTSDFMFKGEREGLPTVHKEAKGFSAHFTLAVAADESREPLGVLGLFPFFQKQELLGLTESQKTIRHQETPRKSKKSSRWEAQALETNGYVPSNTRAIHLMDQEADDYSVFSALCVASLSFVIRVEPRRLTVERVRADELLSALPATLFREVPVAPRSKAQASKPHPQRKARTAALSVRASAVTLPRPRTSPEAVCDSLSLNAVHVFEASPPGGEQPIEWMLFTTEPIGSIEEIAAVVDHYRARWVIEEYFKALKTGCSFEKRQLCSYEVLLRALALFVPLAWKLLLLRNLGRDNTPRLATKVFSDDQLRLLCAILRERRRELPDKPTVRDAMLGIAALGGHIKNNGDPGWQVLGRGLHRFSEFEEGWNLRGRCDQS
ncbi:MAG: putative transposase [Polyangiaceae bacterium]|nr:putative transposase [Polyangiaceae bacterium]